MAGGRENPAMRAFPRRRFSPDVLQGLHRTSFSTAPEVLHGIPQDVLHGTFFTGRAFHVKPFK